MKLAMMEDIKGIVGKLDDKDETIDEHKADKKAILEGADAIGLRKDALKSAMRLRKLEPAKLTAWFITFDRVVEALGLRDQLDLEQAIDAADDWYERLKSIGDEGEEPA